MPPDRGRVERVIFRGRVSKVWVRPQESSDLRARAPSCSHGMRQSAFVEYSSAQWLPSNVVLGYIVHDSLAER
jgi:hypothetical protein